MSVVLLGSTSGSITLQEPAIAGNTVLDLPNTSGSLVVTSGAQTVQFGAGSASAPSVTFTGDTNTGIFSPGADTLAFSEGGTEVMRIDSSGQVGIGTASPNQKLVVAGNIGSASASGTDSYLNVSTNGVQNTFLGFNNSGSTNVYGVLNNNSYIGNGNAYGLQFLTNGSVKATIDTGGNVGIGTSSPSFKLQINVSAGTNALNITDASASDFQVVPGISSGVVRVGPSAGAMAFYSNNTERMRIASGGIISIAKTTDNSADNGAYFNPASSGFFHFVVTNTTTTGSQSTMYLNRQGSDGQLIDFRQADTTEGSISVSGTTVSYNGGHLSRWSQLPDGSEDDTILKGTVVSNLDDMCIWVKDGETLPNEQLNKMKISDVEGDINVAGVFVNWIRDEDCNSDDMNVAMTGDMIIRIAEGVTVQKGDLLMSAGDGTAKPQGDDIVRSKTIAKVTSNYITCTYADGSYCVPCVLMAC